VGRKYKYITGWVKNEGDKKASNFIDIVSDASKIGVTRVFVVYFRS